MNPIVFVGLPYTKRIKKRKETQLVRNLVDGGYVVELEYILDEVCKYLELNVDRIKSNGRQAQNVKARFYYFYLARQHTNYSFANVGSIVGKDHASVMHGCKQIESYLSYDKEVINDLEQLETIILKEDEQRTD